MLRVPQGSSGSASSFLATAYSSSAAAAAFASILAWTTAFCSVSASIFIVIGTIVATWKSRATHDLVCHNGASTHKLVCGPRPPTDPQPERGKTSGARWSAPAALPSSRTQWWRLFRRLPPPPWARQGMWCGMCRAPPILSWHPPSPPAPPRSSPQGPPAPPRADRQAPPRLPYVCVYNARIVCERTACGFCNRQALPS